VALAWRPLHRWRSEWRSICSCWTMRWLTWQQQPAEETPLGFIGVSANW
jgi:hypothetical protein